MDMIKDIAIQLAQIYVIGIAIFVSYSALEISALHRQHESTRDKNLKNSLTSNARLIKADMKSCWKWPLIVVLSIKDAFKWLKDTQ